MRIVRRFRLWLRRLVCIHAHEVEEGRGMYVYQKGTREQMRVHGVWMVCGRCGRRRFKYV